MNFFFIGVNKSDLLFNSSVFTEFSIKTEILNLKLFYKCILFILIMIKLSKIYILNLNLNFSFSFYINFIRILFF
jgi:hypothetical protein